MFRIIKPILLLLLILCTTTYALLQMRQIVFRNPAPFILECVGVALDPAKNYAISNAAHKSDNTLVVDFPHGSATLPPSLGTLVYNSSAHEYQLETTNELLDRNSGGLQNPFFAIGSSIPEGRLRAGSDIRPSSTISQSLLEQGVKFNSPSGDRSTRTSLHLFAHAGVTYLNTQTEGIGTKYNLRSDGSNEIWVICNQRLRNTDKVAFVFSNTTDQICRSRITVDVRSPFTYSYRVESGDGALISSADGSGGRFVVGPYLFNLTPIYSIANVATLAAFVLVIFAFQLYFLHSHIRANAPPVKSLIAIRVLLNCVALLSVPIYLIASSVTVNRSIYLIGLIALNASYFTPKKFLHRPSWLIDRNWFRSLLVLVCVLLTTLAFLFASNESVFGIPVLHLQKIGAICLILGTGSDRPRNIQIEWVRIALILGYAFMVSVLTSDMGSFLYIGLTLLIIELVQKTILLSRVAVCIVLLAVGLFAIYFGAGGIFSEGKLYRLVAPYASPDSERLQSASEADRETYSSLHLIQKELLEGDSPEAGQLVIPRAMQSTSFSDYAFFWSLVIGKTPFLCLFLTVDSFLLYELSFLLVLAVRPTRISKNEVFILPITKESGLAKFLLALALVTFAYPVLSNLLLLPLTGQSLPCLSISIMEVGFLGLFLILISSIFTDPSHIAKSELVDYAYSDLIKNLRFGAGVIVAGFFLVCIVKVTDVRARPGSYAWDKNAVLVEGVPTQRTDKETLIAAAKDLMGGQDLTNLRRKTKSVLRELASLYYHGKSFSQLYLESPRFENSIQTLSAKMDALRSFDEGPRVISGRAAPFGNVYRFDQRVNGRTRTAYTNDFYASIPPDSTTVNADLTAELASILASHMHKLGTSNIGSIVVVDNRTGGMVANSSYPLATDMNVSEIHYNIGSLKKILIAYCALTIDERYKTRVYNGRTFDQFLEWSDDIYAASLLKDLMLNHEDAFADVLKKDFGLPLVSTSDDGYFDTKPDVASYSKALDKMNEIYRYAIGQQKPYRFTNVMKWYARVASGLRLDISYSARDKSFNSISIDPERLAELHRSLNMVLSGTARVVKDRLKDQSIPTEGLIAKTGTAQSESGSFNTSSSFVIANERYTIGIMLSGRIPANSEGLAAKDLFSRTIPILRRYGVF